MVGIYGSLLIWLLNSLSMIIANVITHLHHIIDDNQFSINPFAGDTTIYVVTEHHLTKSDQF